MQKNTRGVKTGKLIIGFAAGLTLCAGLLSADPPGAVKPHPAPDSKAIAALIQKGQEAFDAGDMDKAQQAFSDAFDADPANSTAARDLGIVLIRQDKPAKAAHPLEVAAKVKSPDRFLVLALAAHRVSTKVPMQGVKFITVYFDSHPAPDEPMLNALGIALAQAESAHINSALATDAGKTYKKLNAKLEATRPGEKRWGTDWMPAGDADKLQATLTSFQKTVAGDTAAVQKLDGKIADTQRQKDAVRNTEGDNNQTQKKQSLQKQIDQLQGDLAKAQKDLDDAQKTLDDTKPKWPETIPVESISLGTVPAVAPATPGDPTPDAKTADAKPVEQKPEVKVDDVKPPEVKTPDVKSPDEIPKWPHYAAAFAVSPELLVTVSSAVTDASEIKVQVEPTVVQTASVVRTDAGSGLTLLRVTGAHFSPIPLATASKSGAVKCESFPMANIFGPVLGEVAGSVNIATPHCTVKFDKTPRLPGGPLLQDGKVVGVERIEHEKDRADIPVVSVEELKTFLAADAAAKNSPANMKNSVFQITAMP